MPGRGPVGLGAGVGGGGAGERQARRPRGRRRCACGTWGHSLGRGRISFRWGWGGGRDVEAVGLEDGASLGVEPIAARAVVVELDAVAVGVVEVDGDGAAVVGAVVDRDAVVEQPLDGAAELVAVGVEERDVVEARVAGRRRRGAGALPRVQADVVVVVAGREERGVEAHRAPVGGHAEAERVAVEGHASGRGRRPSGARGPLARRGGWVRSAWSAVSRGRRGPASVDPPNRP